jgi:hypothetical protein
MLTVETRGLRIISALTYKRASGTYPETLDSSYPSTCWR